MISKKHSHTGRVGIVFIQIVLVTLVAYPLFAADEPSLADKAKQAGTEAKEAVGGAVNDAKNAIKDASESAERSLENIWKRIDTQRLKNRTPDQIVAWVIMGVLVGAVAGMAAGLKSTGLGKLGALMLGLVGASIGGIIVQVGRLDFGWGPVLIRYEELLFSFVGALFLIAVGKYLRSKSRKQPQ